METVQHNVDLSNVNISAKHEENQDTSKIKIKNGDKSHLMNGLNSSLNVQEEKCPNQVSNERNKNSEEKTIKTEQSTIAKRNKRKNKNVEDLDEIFPPKNVDLENGEMDEYE